MRAAAPFGVGGGAFLGDGGGRCYSCDEAEAVGRLVYIGDVAVEIEDAEGEAVDVGDDVDVVAALGWKS